VIIGRQVAEYCMPCHSVAVCQEKWAHNIMAMVAGCSTNEQLDTAAHLFTQYQQLIDFDDTKKQVGLLCVWLPSGSWHWRPARKRRAKFANIWRTS